MLIPSICLPLHPSFSIPEPWGAELYRLTKKGFCILWPFIMLANEMHQQETRGREESEVKCVFPSFPLWGELLLLLGSPLHTDFPLCDASGLGLGANRCSHYHPWGTALSSTLLLHAGRLAFVVGPFYWLSSNCTYFLPDPWEESDDDDDYWHGNNN